MTIGVTSCASMVLIGEGDIMLASALFFIGNIGVSGSTVFYDSLLPHVARRRNRSRVVGRLRDGLHQRRRAAADQPGVDPDAGNVWLRRTRRATARRSSRWRSGGRRFRSRCSGQCRSRRRARQRGFAIGAAFSRLGQTFSEIRRYRNAFMLFIAMLLYQDGIQTVIRMASVYGAEVGIDQNAQIARSSWCSSSAFRARSCSDRWARASAPSAASSSRSASTSSRRPRLFHDDVTHFFVLAFLVATVHGRSQALSRALFARMIPHDRTSEFFGFLRCPSALRRVRPGLFHQRDDHRQQQVGDSRHPRIVCGRRVRAEPRR
jgi:UMF1 family MFS transporter